MFGQRDNMHLMFESRADMGGVECYVVLLSTSDAGYLRVYNGKEILSETYVTEGAYMEVSHTSFFSCRVAS